MTIDKYGYARVSTRDQDLSIQEATLKAAGCRIIRMEKASGTSRNGRPARYPNTESRDPAPPKERRRAHTGIPDRVGGRAPD